MDQQFMSYLIDIDNRILQYQRLGDLNSMNALINNRNQNLAAKGYDCNKCPIGFLNQQQQPMAYQQAPVTYQQPVSVPVTGYVQNNTGSFIQPYNAGNPVQNIGNGCSSMGLHSNSKYASRSESERSKRTRVSNEPQTTTADVTPEPLPLNKIPFEFITANGVTSEKRINGGYYELEFKGKTDSNYYQYKLINYNAKNDNIYIPQFLNILKSKNKSKDCIYRVNTHRQYLCVNDVNTTSDNISGFEEIVNWCKESSNDLVKTISSILNSEMVNVYKYRVIYTENDYAPFIDIKAFVESFKDENFINSITNSSDKKLVHTMNSVVDSFFDSIKIVKSDVSTEGFEDVGSNIFELRIPITKYYIYHDRISADFKIDNSNDKKYKELAINEYSHEILYKLLESNEANDSLFTYVVFNYMDKPGKVFRVLKHKDVYILKQER